MSNPYDSDEDVSDIPLLPWPTIGGHLGDVQRALRGRTEAAMMRAIMALREGRLSYETAICCIGEMAGLQTVIRELELASRRREKGE